jgi:hypothetical protein
MRKLQPPQTQKKCGQGGTTRSRIWVGSDADQRPPSSRWFLAIGKLDQSLSPKIQSDRDFYRALYGMTFSSPKAIAIYPPRPSADNHQY